MHRIWAVATQTLKQCLRSRIQVLFIALLAVFLLVLPRVMAGDNTLAGRIRSFLSYSQAITAILLGIITILMSVQLLSADVSRKYVMTVATKPLPRWQYVLGRWLGTCMLDAVLLLLAALVIYGQAQLMRRGDALNPTDRRTVESEIFNARAKIPPQPIGIEQAVRNRLRELRQDEAAYQRLIEKYMIETGGGEEEAFQALIQQLAKDVSGQMEVAQAATVENGRFRLGETLRWEFEGIHPPERTADDSGEILRIDRGRALDATGKATREVRRYRVEVSSEVLGHLMEQGPVRLGGVEARVSRLSADWFEAVVDLERAQGSALATIETGQSIEVVAEPTVNLQFKMEEWGGERAVEIEGMWRISNPSGTEQYRAIRRDPRDMTVHVAVPARVAGEDGRVVVEFVNISGTDVRIEAGDVALWYPVSSFAANFFRSMLLRWVQLAFLSAVGVFFGTFLSFAVGIIASFCLLPFGIMRQFLSEAAGTGAGGEGVVGIFSRILLVIQYVMFALLPDLQSTSTGDYLVDGLVIPWSLVGSAAGLTLALRCTVLLGLACWIWHERELAKPQES